MVHRNDLEWNRFSAFVQLVSTYRSKPKKPKTRREPQPAVTDKIIAASFTVVVIGPTESRYLLIGITPALDTRPTVGFKPTTLLR